MPRWFAPSIGFDQKRGDQVEVVNLRFAETPANPISEPTGWLSAFHFTKDDIMRAIEMAVMGLLGLVVLLMVVRPLVRRVLTPEERPLRAAGGNGSRRKQDARSCRHAGRQNPGNRARPNPARPPR